ncbi:MAG: hypothetical protein IKH84_01535, partial [Ottowia sp.]|nr:hypothetical protein [Ottowia sp.]
MQSSFPPSRHSWFGTLPPREGGGGGAAVDASGQQHSDFARLWTNFMSARALLALALLLMQAMVAWGRRGAGVPAPSNAVLGLCIAYAAVTVFTRTFGRAYDANGRP